jgi:hypothetical protein
MKRSDIKPDTVYAVYKYGITGDTVYAHTGKPVEIKDETRKVFTAARWDWGGHDVTEKVVRFYSALDGQHTWGGEPFTETVVHPRQIKNTVCPLNEFPAWFAERQRKLDEAAGRVRSEKAAQAERIERFEAAMRASGIQRPVFSGDDHYFAKLTPDVQDWILAAVDPQDLAGDHDDYDPERDDFEDETDTPPDYEGDR